MRDGFFYWATIAALASIILPCTLFVIRYAIWPRSDWRSTVIGRVLLTKAIAIDVILIITMLRVFWPDFPPVLSLRIILFLAISVAFWWQYFVLVRIQREERAGRDLLRADPPVRGKP